MAFHFLYFFLTFVLASVFTVWLGWAGGARVMALLWLPMLWAVPALWQRVFREDQDLHWLAIPMALLTAMNVCMTFPTALPLVLQGPLPSIRASEIGNYPGVPAFRFTDAVVRRDYAYRRVARVSNGRRSSTFTTVYFTVAPITGSEWSSEQAVPAWAACDGNGARSSRCSDWGKANAGAVIIDSYAEMGMAQTVREAVAKYGLRDAPAPRIFKWVESVEDEIRARVIAYAASLFGIYIAWMVLYLLGRVVSRRRKT